MESMGSIESMGSTFLHSAKSPFSVICIGPTWDTFFKVYGGWKSVFKGGGNIGLTAEEAFVSRWRESGFTSQGTLILHLTNCPPSFLYLTSTCTCTSTCTYFSLNMSLACRVPTQIWRDPCPLPGIFPFWSGVLLCTGTVFGEKDLQNAS
jgi:hypothetical protein